MQFTKLIGFLFIFQLIVISSADASQQGILQALSRRDYGKAYQLAMKRSGEPFTNALAKWYYLRHNGVIAPFHEYQSFLRDHPDWPEKESMLERMEIAFLNSDPTIEEKQQWFKANPPKTSRGVTFFLDAHGNLTQQRLNLLWIDADYSAKEEAYIMAKYGKMLTQDMHIKRVDRLLWEEKAIAAERLLRKLPNTQQKLAQARIILMRKGHNPDGAVNSVPRALQYHPGLIYERVRFRANAGNYAGVEELLLQAPANLPYAHLWWNYQNRVIRDAIEQRRYDVAKLLLDKHSQIKPFPRVEAEWMRGWLYYTFLKQAATAAPAFENIYHTASMPISKSRGAYWAGRAYEDAGNKAKAKDWYQKAAIYPTTFYGQLAHQHLYPKTALPFPAFMPPVDKDIERFVGKTPLAREFREFSRVGYPYLLYPLIEDEIKRSNDPAYASHFAALARQLGEHAIAIKIANEALIKGIYVAELYPIVKLPKELAIDPAFALAIARQESRFDVKATSSANAKGLMQLLPSTASRVAKQHHLPYHEGKLYDPQYNAVLGSHYMAGLMQRFQRAKILAIAGYNAGPGRPDSWQDRFGTLSKTDFKQNIQWSEMIPFGETRNYVQRVLENYHVYKYLLSKNKPVLRAEEILTDFGKK